jgi:hypothetical protein
VPLAAKLLVGYALLLAVQRAVDVATGRYFDFFGGPESHRELPPEAAWLYRAYVALVLASTVGVALRRRWGLTLFAISWGVNYFISLGVQLPRMLGRLPTSELLSLLLPCYLVLVNGLYAALAIVYVGSAALRRAVLGSGPPQAQWVPEPWRAAPLPAPAKLLAAQALAGNALVIAFFVQALPMFARQYGPRGLWSPLSLLSLLDQVPYSRPAAGIMVALAGIVGAVMLFLRRHWGRWLLIGAGCIQALPQLGYWLSISDMARGFGAERLLPSRIHWDMAIGIALIIGYVAFEIGYLCDRTVREVMTAEGEE